MPTEHQIIDPLTGETVTFTNPWTYDASRSAWVADDVDYVSGDQFNNLLRFGQPFDPNNHLTGQFYRHDLEGSVPSTGPTVIFDQENVITQGYGSNINFDDFDLVRDLRSGTYSSQLQEGQTYTLSDLQALGISPPVIGSNGQDYGDHALSTDLYGTGSPYPGTDRPAEMAYIFGSVRYRISEDTTFSIVDGELVVNGHIELFDDDFNHVGGVHPWVSAIVQVGAGDYAAFPEVVILYEGEGAERSISQVIPSDSCFGPEVPIDMWPLDPEFAPDPKNPFKQYDQDAVRAKIWKKPIHKISVGDWVVSHDKNGNMVPGYVPRTMINDAKILLDFHGTAVTPGHVYYRPDSKRTDKYETLIDVLRDDGMIEDRDGVKLRAATYAPVDGPLDKFVKAVTGTLRPDGGVDIKEQGRIRLGTRFIVRNDKGRKDYSVADLIEAGGGVVGDDELIRVGDGPGIPFHWDFGDTLPKPEDFVLAASGTTLEDIYKAAEWESQGPRMPAPMVLDGGPVQPLKGAELSAMPRNEPLNLGHTPEATQKPQRMMNRKQRKAMEAKSRKAVKARKRAGS